MLAHIRTGPREKLGLDAIDIDRACSGAWKGLHQTNHGASLFAGWKAQQVDSPTPPAPTSFGVSPGRSTQSPFNYLGRPRPRRSRRPRQ